jgi:hypothetical protein
VLRTCLAFNAALGFQLLKKVIKYHFFISKIAIDLSLDFHAGHPSFRKSLQPSALKRDHPPLQK